MFESEKVTIALKPSLVSSPVTCWRSVIFIFNLPVRVLRFDSSKLTFLKSFCVKKIISIYQVTNRADAPSAPFRIQILLCSFVLQLISCYFHLINKDVYDVKVLVYGI